MSGSSARDISGARHRHVLGQGAAYRRRSARGRGSLDAAQRLAPSSTVERAGSRRLVRGRRGGGRRDPPPCADGIRGARRDRPLRPDAWRDPARRADKPLRPAILWNDGRSFAECAELKRRVPDLEQRTGNLAMPGFTAPKMLWVAEHEPEVARATRRVLLPKDYVRLRLSGEAVSEMSDASGTLWLDVGRRRWDDEPARGDRPDRASHAAPRRGLGDLGVSCAGDRERLGPRGPQDSDRGRRRRQRSLGDRRRRDRGPARASSRSAPRA